MTEETKVCTRCAKSKPVSKFYKSGAYRNSWCSACCVEYQQELRRQRRMSGEFWYKEASGGKNPLPFNFTHLVQNSDWRKVGPVYVKVISTYERKLTRTNNRKAAHILQQHLKLGVPTHLPYELKFTGEEWPIIAHALCLVKDRDDDRCRLLKRLYNQLLNSRREAKYDHESKSV